MPWRRPTHFLFQYDKAIILVQRLLLMLHGRVTMMLSK
jgi:hypothetical protein